jgi:hypothetical protein
MARPLLLVTGIAEGLGAEVLDGLIEEVQTEQRFGASSSARMSPKAVAQACLDLTTQHPSAWTHEMDLRPFSERF